jgi:omega-amidase
MKIAAAQIACEVGKVERNLRKIRSFAGQAKNNGAEWVIFPEMSDTGYVMSVIRERASPWSKGAVPQLQLLARELALGIICGVSQREDERIYNAQVVIDGAGRIIGKYRKTHLFAPTPVEEHKCFAAGSELAAVPMGELRAGLSICYDLRFPEIYRVLAIDGRANVFLISSAWPVVRREHLRILATARAIENQSYVVLANRVGTDNGGRLCGNSAIIDPSGAILAAASNDGEELVEAEISPEALEPVRERMPIFAHRRPELYAVKMSPGDFRQKGRSSSTRPQRRGAPPAKSAN